MKRCVLKFAALGFIAAGISYAVLYIADDTVKYFHIRSLAILIWPTALFLMANEFANSSLEVATNFAWAIGGNVVLYAAAGVILCGGRTILRKISTRRET